MVVAAAPRPKHRIAQSQRNRGALLSPSGTLAFHGFGHDRLDPARSGVLPGRAEAAPRDLVLVEGIVSHLMLDWAERRHAHFLHRLGTFSRLIRFDKRDTGMSDRPGGLPDLETRMGGLIAVMDAARSERAVPFGYSKGGPMSIHGRHALPSSIRPECGTA